MSRFEIHTRFEDSDQWFIDAPIDPTWAKSQHMAIAQVEVLIQRARKQGKVLLGRVVLVPRVGKKRVVWQSEQDCRP